MSNDYIVIKDNKFVVVYSQELYGAVPYGSIGEDYDQSLQVYAFSKKELISELARKTGESPDKIETILNSTDVFA